MKSTGSDGGGAGVEDEEGKAGDVDGESRGSGVFDDEGSATGDVDLGSEVGAIMVMPPARCTGQNSRLCSWSVQKHSISWSL